MYVEFKDVESVPLAMGLTGQKLLGVPIIVQPSQVGNVALLQVVAVAGGSQFSLVVVAGGS